MVKNLKSQLTYTKHKRNICANRGWNCRDEHIHYTSYFVKICNSVNTFFFTQLVLLFQPSYLIIFF